MLVGVILGEWHDAIDLQKFAVAAIETELIGCHAEPAVDWCCQPFHL